MNSLDSVKILNTILADTYSLYLKYQNYHWNVEGKQFYSLHNLFEENYKSLADMVDEIAERIRACKNKVIATFEDFLAHSGIKRGDCDLNDKKMIEDLCEGHIYLINYISSNYNLIEKDIVTADMITQYSNYHQKTLWMLKSIIE